MGRMGWRCLGARKHRMLWVLVVFIIMILVKGNTSIAAASNGDSWRRVAYMPTKKSYLAAAVVDGKIYAIGGYFRYEMGPHYLATVEEYDPVTNSWRRLTPMPTTRGNLAAAVVDGKIYAIGGYFRDEKGPHYLATVEEYDPVTNSWRHRNPMPTARGNLAAAVVDGKIYAIGGWGRSGTLAMVEEYDPATDMWHHRTAMPIARAGFAAATVRGWIYAIGGFDGNMECSIVEEYNPPFSDTDGDGLADGFEVGNGLDPLAASDAEEDPDQDGLTNFEEYQHRTSLTSPDTDEDGLSDRRELQQGTNPLNQDTDGDWFDDIRDPLPAINNFFIILPSLGIVVTLGVTVRIHNRPQIRSRPQIRQFEELTYPVPQKPKFREVFCPSCFAALEHRASRCLTCGEEFPLCVICGWPTLEDRTQTPCCGAYVHTLHLLEWVRVKGICPACGKRLKEGMIHKPNMEELILRSLRHGSIQNIRKKEEQKQKTQELVRHGSIQNRKKKGMQRIVDSYLFSRTVYKKQSRGLYSIYI